jgi:hypothetical protein
VKVVLGSGVEADHAVPAIPTVTAAAVSTTAAPLTTLAAELARQATMPIDVSVTNPMDFDEEQRNAIADAITAAACAAMARANAEAEDVLRAMKAGEYDDGGARAPASTIASSKSKKKKKKGKGKEPSNQTTPTPADLNPVPTTIALTSTRTPRTPAEISAAAVLPTTPIATSGSKEELAELASKNLP